MPTLQEFIHGRMKELASSEQLLRHQLKAIDAERTQLRAAAQAAGLHVELASEAEGPKTFGPFSVEAIEAEFMRLLGRLPSKRGIPEKTIKEAVIEVLEVIGGGLTASDILAAINAKFGTDYPRTSLSPQLSRLKSEGKLTREGNLWSLALDGPKTIEPDHQTSEGTNDRAQDTETNSATVEPVEEVAHENMKTRDIFN
ncbi:hypothetical protein ASG72_04535 [Bosea sp. Leaf344]|uniref:hypothetical protein n=1 Tax=Bosea sp. Leaf344 TaxID=1736346 RepID=UPI0006FB4EDA|nr:hypothetical protein [Bosea sp. Leaf344]KQU54880.1 hypothetical protein ASG72_04535 [Bosea sp. Leaf344]